MNKRMLLAWTLTAALALSACAPANQSAGEKKEETKSEQSETVQPETAAPEEEKAPETGDYEVISQTYSSGVGSDDDNEILLSQVVYVTPRLRIEDDGDPDEHQAKVIRAFNDRMEQTVVNWVQNSGLSAEAKEDYNSRSEEGKKEFLTYTQEVSIGDTYRTGTLLTVSYLTTSFTGGAHPNNGIGVWMFDLQTGEFVTLRDMTDDPEGMRQAIIDGVLERIGTADLGDELFEDYEETIRNTEDFTVNFNVEGMEVIFSEYEISSHAAGPQIFTVTYAEFYRYLNGLGRRLLELPLETRILGNFLEAQEMWYWFNMTPLEMDTSTIIHTDDTGLPYYKVTDRRASTMEELRARLETRFTPEVTEKLLHNGDGAPLYRDVNGVLCGLDAARGADITVADVDYSVELTEGGGKVIARVTRRDFSETGETVLSTGEPDIMEFPFILTEDDAVFTAFDSIW